MPKHVWTFFSRARKDEIKALQVVNGEKSNTMQNFYNQNESNCRIKGREGHDSEKPYLISDQFLQNKY